MSDNITCKRVNISIPSDLLESADFYADSYGMTRSGLISIALRQYLDAVTAMPDLKIILNSMASVAQGTLRGEMSEAVAQAKIEAIQEVYDALQKKIH